MSLLGRLAALADEYDRRYHGRYYGIYRGLVKDNNDPLKAGRVRVLCPALWGTKVSTWVAPALPMGSGGGGMTDFKVPPLSDASGGETGVLIMLDAGDKDKPIYTGTWITAPTAFSSISRAESPVLAQGTPDNTVVSDKGVGVQPSSPYAAEYPYNRVVRTQGGHTEEVDDTPGAERYHRAHPSGHYVEVTPAGSENRNVVGNRATTVRGRSIEEVLGSHVWRVGNDLDVNVGGNLTWTVAGAMTWDFEGAYDLVMASTSLDVSGDYSMKAMGAASLKAGGNLEVNAGQTLTTFAGGRWLSSCMADAEEVIANVNAEDVGKKVVVYFGKYQIQVATGGIEIFTGLDPLTPFAKLSLGITGTWSLENVAGFSLECDALGNISVNGLTVGLGGVGPRSPVAYSGSALAGSAGPFPIAGTVALGSFTVSTTL